MSADAKVAVYTLTKVKTFTGHDGYGLNAVVCRDGKPIAFAMDDASGGEMEIDFTNPLQTPASYKATTPEMAKVEEAAFRKWAMEQQTADEKRRDEEYAKAVGVADTHTERFVGFEAMTRWINKTVDELQTKKRFDRLAKTKTLFRLKGDKPDEWRTLKVPYDARVQAHFDQKYAGQVEAIWGVAR